MLIKAILKRLLRNRILYGLVRSAYLESRTNTSNVTGSYGIIPEVLPIESRQSQFFEERINLIVPALSTQHVFGGISTALQFFQELSKHFKNVRLILSDQPKFSKGDNPDFSTWTIRSMDDDDIGGFLIIPAGDRYKKTLPIGRGDKFIATAWWTAVLAKSLCEDQVKFNGANDVLKRFIYFIQDFEPGFYPWSSRYALSESTYHNPDKFIPIFNSDLLSNFFAEAGYQFEQQYTFRLHLNPELLKLHKKFNIQRKKQILIYGRPSVERNAFDLIVMGLREWLNRTEVLDWEFVSVGEEHSDVKLGNGHTLKSIGKLTLEAYAQKLFESSIGISLMISPHPSYPPLEMAAFGINVITNSYRSKNLSKLSNNIYSLESVNPTFIADTLDFLYQKHDAERYHMSAWMQEYLSNNNDFTRICCDIINSNNF